MQPVDLKVLLEAGSHFGHKTNKWNPKASTFIYKAVGDTHIIDLAKTKEGLEKAAKAIFDIAKNGGEVVFIGTKRQAAPIVKELASQAGAAYFSTRWIGGFITNFEEVKKNVDKLENFRKDLKDQNALSEYTKFERVQMEKEMNKLDTIYGGVVKVAKRPQALFVIDIKKESAALKEADQYKIPTIGVVDTNADPSLVAYPIPANDDAVGSITYIVKYIADAYKEGRTLYEKALATPIPAPTAVKSPEKKDKSVKNEKKPAKSKSTEKPKVKVSK